MRCACPAPCSTRRCRRSWRTTTSCCPTTPSDATGHAECWCPWRPILAPEQRAVKKDDAAATAAPAAPADPAETEVGPERVHLHMPVDVRNLALAVIAVLLSLYMLHWAQAVVVPVLLGVMFSYALTPAIDRMERWRLPRAAASGLLLTAIVA